MTTDASTMSTYAAIRRALTEVPIIARRLWLVLLLNLGGTAVQILIPVIVQRTLDQYILSGDQVDVGGVMMAAVIGIVIVVVGGIMTRTGLVRLVRQASTGLSQMRVLVFSHLLRRSVLHVQTERRGALVSRVTSDL
ncbi:MAG: ABC transporter transmembrane domain-containing protein, partial [Actinomycetota bacterium]